jgi:hypothetical protein
MPSRSKARGQLKSINSFWRSEIDDRYIDSPYYLAPGGKVGQDAFAVIRDTIAKMNMVAIGRVVLTRRKHIMALEAKGRGLATVPCSARSIRARGVPIAPPQLTPVLNQAPSRWHNLQWQQAPSRHAERQSLDRTRSRGGTSLELGQSNPAYRE